MNSKQKGFIIELRNFFEELSFFLELSRGVFFGRNTCVIYDTI
jgi:hypothetical protein